MVVSASERSTSWTSPSFAHLLDRLQGGVVSRRQLRELGARDHDIARMVRRRELTPVHRGVYVNHTGPLTWAQRCWVAVLACWPAALSHESARPAGLRRGPVHVAVCHRRTLRAPAWVVVHRTAELDQRVDWRRSPPRVLLAHASLDVALGKRSVAGQFAALAADLQTRELRVQDLRGALASRRRHGARQVVGALLDDLESGACSVLERGYLDLERRHGMPGADRQQQDSLGGRTIYRDAPYADLGLVVELDGRAFHDTAAARDRDADRDLDTRVADGSETVRLTHGQVFDRGCETVRKVATLLERRGWAGPFVSCPDCP